MIFSQRFVVNYFFFFFFSQQDNKFLPQVQLYCNTEMRSSKKKKQHASKAKIEKGWEAPGSGDTLPRDIPAAAPSSPKPATCFQDDAATHTFPTESGLLCHGQCPVTLSPPP